MSDFLKRIKEIEDRLFTCYLDLESLRMELEKENKNDSSNKYNENEVEFIEWLKSKKLSEKSIDRYIDSLRRISNDYFLYTGEHINCDISLITDLNTIKLIISSLNNSDLFIQTNLKFHHMYSAALNNFFKFLCSKSITVVIE